MFHVTVGTSEILLACYFYFLLISKHLFDTVLFYISAKLFLITDSSHGNDLQDSSRLFHQR